MASLGALFRARGSTTNDSKYATNARVYSTAEMLAYRETWTEPLAPSWDFDEIIAAARTPAEVKVPEKLEMSENGFKVADREALDAKEKIVRQIQHTLNRLTDQNYDTLMPECLKEEALDQDVIDDWVARIFAKALDEPMFCSLYAKLALDIAKYELQTMSKKGVRTAIVQRAQAVYEQDRSQFRQWQEEEEKERQRLLAEKERIKKERKEAKKAKKKGGKVEQTEKESPEPEGAEDFLPERQLTEEEKENADKLRKKKLVNMKLIGELLRCGLLADRVIIAIIQGLILSGDRPPEVDVEMVLELLKVAGELLERRDGIAHVYNTLEQLLTIQPPLSNRVKFAIMDLIDLRKKGWKDEKKKKKETAIQQKPGADPQKTGGAGGKRDISPLPDSMNQSTNSLPGSKPGSPTSGKPGTTFGPQAPQISDEQIKKVQVKMKEAALSQIKTQEAVQEAVKTLRAGGERNYVRDALVVHHCILMACSSTDESLQEALFATFLMKGVWEPEEVARGVSWAATHAIQTGLAEDVPKFFPRFATNLIKSGWLLDRLASDVFGKVAWCIDVTRDAEVIGEWLECFLNFWEFTLKEAAKEEHKVTLVDAAGVLDGMALAKFTGFWQDAVPDMVTAMYKFDLANTESVAAWYEKKKNVGAARKLCDELQLLI